MLEPGQHTIETSKVRKNPQGGLVMSWSIKLWDGAVKQPETKGKTVGVVRDRARKKAAQMLAQGPTKWTLDDNAGKYLEAVTLPAIEALSNKNTRSRYLTAYSQFTGHCTKHQHEHGLAAQTLRSAVRFRSLESCLQEISKLHGGESARQARNVLSKYFIHQLRRDELIAGSPLADMSIDMKTMAKNPPIKTVTETLTVDQYMQVMNYLLNVDPADVQRPKRGRYSKEDAMALRQKLKDLTILQASTGLRVTEANLAWCGLILGDANSAGINVVKEIAKNDTPRRTAIKHQDAAAYLIQLRENRRPKQLIIGTPTKPEKVWDSGNRSKQLRRFYEEMAKRLDLPFLALPGELTHQWRRHLNTILLDSVPEVVRAADLGHSTQTNQAYYTDTNQWQQTGRQAIQAIAKSR